MKILSLIGSRNRAGRTAQCSEAVIAGAEAHARRAGVPGAEAEQVFLTEVRIERCRQCDAGGWGLCRNEGRCVIADDFAALVAKAREADVVLFATPVYFSDLSESMKAFLDRLRRTGRHADGKAGIEAKPAVGICLAGGGGGGAPHCAFQLDRTLATCGFDVLDVIPVRRQNFDLKLQVLRATGEWLAVRPAAGK